MTDASRPDAKRPLRLLVVDDHEVVRQGLVALLDRRENFQVVAELKRKHVVGLPMRCLPFTKIIDRYVAPER